MLFAFGVNIFKVHVLGGENVKAEANPFTYA